MCRRRLAREEGIFISGRRGLLGARRWQSRVENATIVFIVCDRGDRYLSTGVFPHHRIEGFAPAARWPGAGRRWKTAAMSVCACPAWLDPLEQPDIGTGRRDRIRRPDPAGPQCVRLGRMFIPDHRLHEAGETPQRGLRARSRKKRTRPPSSNLIGVYDFQRMNQVIIVTMPSSGEVRLSSELANTSCTTRRRQMLASRHRLCAG